MIDEQVTKIVANIIKERHPNLWVFSQGSTLKDDAGNRIFVHEDSLCWESAAWLDYEVLDRINEQIEALDLNIQVAAEYGNSYEVIIYRI